MKLIRTLIDTKRSDASEPLRPSQIAQKPQTEKSTPVTEALRAKKALSEPLDPKLKEFKSDLAELTPRRTPAASDPKRKKVWDLDAEKLATPLAEVRTQPIAEPDLDSITAPRPSKERVSQERPLSTPNMFEVPNPLQPRRALSGGRVKTRIMGFGLNDASNDVFCAENAAKDGGLEFPVGWLVITKGPGRGKSFVLQSVVSTIGRAEDQTICLNFGDDTISRNNHAAVAFDDQMNTCFLGYGGKANLVRLNGRPVLATEQLNHGDIIRVGETDLRFVALCGPEFSWDNDKAQGDD